MEFSSVDWVELCEDAEIGLPIWDYVNSYVDDLYGELKQLKTRLPREPGPEQDEPTQGDYEVSI